ncbi:Rib/alpha-like domain-containing protein, partial [Streptococcus mitis]|nr:Rib/alpha-like domain-containing protein [Streptococcus mitis]
MYFNRKNAEQKNWRMIKKGKHFLFGCSLVFAVGASLATQVVHADTAEATVESNSTTGEVPPTQNGAGNTYAAPATVAEIKPEVATTPAPAAVAEKLGGETAKEVEALDKTKLENYIAEIEAKLANGTYDNKTEESVAVLKADLEAAKTTLANAKTQEELTKSYSKLVTTANTKLKNKPVEKKETPAVDTTNGKETVGKKAENTEKKSESNSIENTGSNDPRNGQKMPEGVQFRANVAYSGDEATNENGKKNDYITSNVGNSTTSGDAQNIGSRVMTYKTRMNKDQNGKITSIDWMLYFNNYAENMDNKYGIRGNSSRNYIQIPKEVNMPESINRLQYKSVQRLQGGKFKKLDSSGNPLSNEVTFDNPSPGKASGFPLAKEESFTSESWKSASRGYDTLYENTGFYFNGADTDNPETKALIDANAIPGKRVIYDNSNTGSDWQDAYVWKFTTTVPETTTNEQLKDMKVVMGMIRTGTASNRPSFNTIGNNPADVTDADVAKPQPKTPQPGVNNTYTQTNDTITVPTVASTDETLTGTGQPGATINIKVNGKTARQVKVAENGQWTFPLEIGLNSNVTGGAQLVPADKISVSQTVNGVESADTAVNVSLGHSEIVPSSKSKQQNNLVENDRNVTLKVPHDAGAAYFQFTDADGNAQEVGLKRDAVPGKWQVNSSSSALASVASSEDGKFYSTINLALNKDMKAGTTAKVISNMQEGSYSSLQGWQSRNVEEAPKEETPAPKPQPEPSKPDTPAADAATSAPEIVNNLEGKASTPADVTVKAPAGSTVKLYNKDGVVIGEAVANDQGVATIHPTNSLPEGEITATSTPAGGKESAKSAPITVTKSPLTIKDGGVTGNNDTRLLVSKDIVTVYPGDKIDVDVVAQATALERFSVEKNPTAISGVVPVGGFLDKSRGATIRQRDAKYSGTVAMNQPAGTTEIVFHARNRDKPTTLYRSLIVNVLETAKKYEPVAGTKVDIADSNGVSETEKNKIIEAVKSANPSLPADSKYSVDEKGNLTITYPDGSKDKIAAAYLVNPAPTDADKNTPTAKPQTVNKGTTPKAEDSIGNIKDLPKGTKVAFKAPVDTATPGEKDATVVVTYPDGSNEEVPVKVTVKAPSSAPTTPTAPATPAAPVVAPTVEIPYSNKDTKEVYVYAGEENSFDIKFKDDSGKIASATVKQGGNRAFDDVAGEANTINTQYGFKANVINAETPATEKAPAVITYSGTPAATDG